MDNYKTGETPEKLSNAIYRHQKLVPGQSTTLHSLQRSRFKIKSDRMRCGEHVHSYI